MSAPNITIDDVPLFNAGRELPRAKSTHRPKKPAKLGIRAERTLERYRAAYRRVYGITPEIKVSGKWFLVKGSSYRVTQPRLRELAEQLEYRAGPENQED